MPMFSGGSGAAQAIDPTQVVPPVYGLLVAARDATADIGDDGWTAGVKWSPELTGQASLSGASPLDCIGDTVTTAMTSAARGAAITQQAFLVWTSDQCSSSGFAVADYYGRAMRKLETEQSYLVAKEWGSGAANLAGTLGNVNLNATSSDEMTAGAVAVDLGFARVEQGIAYYGHGRRGMIHCTPQALFQAVLNGAVEKIGGLWVTPMGNIVVGDAGYDGSAPGGTAAAATQWIYGTEVVDYLLSPIQMLPEADPEASGEGLAEFMAQAMDRTLNKVTTYAARVALVRWDRNIHVGAEISLTVPTIGGA
jgi:hypothetical protein